MITFGYCKGTRQDSSVTMVKVRIPSVHGPYNKANYNGQPIRNYTEDEALPWYPSMRLSRLPVEGEVLVISTLNDGNSDWIILGTTGAEVTNWNF